MRKPQGYALIIDPDAPTWERDTALCCHCNGIIFVKPGTVNTVYLVNMSDGTWRDEPGAFCRNCMKPVCLECDKVGTCQPFERWLLAVEKRFK